MLEVVKRLVVPADAHGRPCSEGDQFGQRTVLAIAHLRRFVVTTPYTVQHGSWIEARQAREVARKLGRDARVVEAEPYWWVPGIGRCKPAPEAAEARIPPRIRRLIASCAQGERQRELLGGQDHWSGGTGRGRAPMWRSRHLAERTKLVDRLNALLPEGYSAETALVGVNEGKHGPGRPRRRLVINVPTSRGSVGVAWTPPEPAKASLTRPADKPTRVRPKSRRVSVAGARRRKS